MTHPLSMATLARRVPVAGSSLDAGRKNFRGMAGNIASISRNFAGNKDRTARCSPLLW
jgi:hypothetical protein